MRVSKKHFCLPCAIEIRLVFCQMHHQKVRALKNLTNSGKTFQSAKSQLRVTKISCMRLSPFRTEGVEKKNLILTWSAIIARPLLSVYLATTRLAVAFNSNRFPECRHKGHYLKNLEESLATPAAAEPHPPSNAEASENPSEKQISSDGLWECRELWMVILWNARIIINQKNSKRLELSISENTPHGRCRRHPGSRPEVPGRFAFTGARNP